MIRFCLAAFLTLCFVKSAVAIDFNDDKGLTVGALVGLTHNDERDFTGVVVTPRIGYRFNSHWEAGALFRYEKFDDATKYSGWGAYGEYAFAHFARGVHLLVEMHALHSTCSSDLDYYYPGMTYPDEKDITEVGFIPGVAYHIPNSPVALKLRYLFLGFNHGSRSYKQYSPGCLGRGNWIIDASLRRLEIGASVTF